MVRHWLAVMAPLLALGVARAETPATPSAAPAPAPAPVSINADARPGESLDGDWQVIVDPQSVGDKSPLPGVDGWAYWRARPYEPSLRLQEYRFDAAHTLKVPGDWNHQAERLYLYDGPVWYHRPFTASPKPGMRYWLAFGAVNYAADVYLNGEKLGSHVGGFTPVAFDVSGKLRDGANWVVVKVDARLDAKSAPTRSIDWLNQGGITRSVKLVALPQAHLRDWWVRLIDPKRGTIGVTVWSDGAAPGAKAQVAIPALGVKAAVPLDAQGHGETMLRPHGLKLWRPGAPTLYDVTLTFGSDSARDRIGFRTLAVRGHDILLNGQPIFLKGVATHDVSPLHPGRAAGEADAAARIAQLKRLNANFVRLAHYPHDSAFLRAADEAGILVWEELPVYWGIAFDDPQTLANVRQQLAEVMARDRNRASLAIWSVANETPAGPARDAFLRTLIADVRAAKDGRLVTAALLPRREDLTIPLIAAVAARVISDDSLPQAERDKVRAWLTKKAGPLSPERLTALAKMPPVAVTDPIADQLDIVSANEYFGWYSAALIGRLSPIDEEVAARKVLDIMPHVALDPALDKPFIVSEFGAEAKAGFTGGPEQFWGETYQARVYEAQLKLLANSKRLAGMTPWVLQDFDSPLRPLYGLQDGFNRKGLVDETGREKAAFGVLSRFYARPGNPFTPRP